MTTPKCPLSLNVIRIKIELVQLSLCLCELQASAPLEERRAAVEAPYPQGSGAAEDYIDGYVDYQTAARSPPVSRRSQLLLRPGMASLRSRHVAIAWHWVADSLLRPCNVGSVNGLMMVFFPIGSKGSGAMYQNPQRIS